MILEEGKKVSVTLLILDVLMVVVSLIFKVFDSSIILGIVYGFIFCLLNFALLGKAVERAVEMAEPAAKKHMQINYAIRFMLLGVIMAIPFLLENVNPWCAIVSMLAPKLTYTAIGFYGLISKKKGE